MFQETCDATTNKAKPYTERAEYLKQKLKGPHAGKNDCKNRPISIQKSYCVTIGIKCLEKQETKSKYVLKHQKNIVIEVDRQKSYKELHELARKFPQK